MRYLYITVRVRAPLSEYGTLFFINDTKIDYFTKVISTTIQF